MSPEQVKSFDYMACGVCTAGMRGSPYVADNGYRLVTLENHPLSKIGRLEWLL